MDFSKGKMKKYIWILISAAMVSQLFLISCGNFQGTDNTESLSPPVTASTGQPDAAKLFQKEIDVKNPFFPYDGVSSEEFQYCAELSQYSTVQWKTELVASGNGGNLFQAGYEGTIEEPGNANDKYADTDEQLKVLLWVTDDAIYWVNGVLDADEKIRLLRDGTVPANASVVCTENAIPDSLEEDELGTHELIEEYPDGIRWYSRWDLREPTAPEGRNCYTMIWRKDVGLVAYQYKHAAPGGGSRQIWNPEYVEPYEVGYKLVD